MFRFIIFFVGDHLKLILAQNTLVNYEINYNHQYQKPIDVYDPYVLKSETPHYCQNYIINSVLTYYLDAATVPKAHRCIRPVWAP